MFIMPLILITILTAIAILLAVADYFLGNKNERNVNINNSEKVIPVKGDATLLTILTDNNIFIPSACGGKATCGYCKVKISEGGGKVLPTEEIFLTRAEKNDDVRLACQVKVRDDILVEIPAELMSVQEYNAVVTEITDLTHDIKFLKLKLISPDNMEFKPGQYAQIKVPGVDVYRAYSIASKPSDGDIIEFIIRLVPKGIATTYVHKVLEVGDDIILTGPYGDFFLQEDSNKDIICIAGGSGMAPFKSILYYMQEYNIDRKVLYFFGARTKSDLYYTDEMYQLQESFPNLTYIPALSEPHPEDEWTGEIGLITEIVDKYCDSLEDSEAYLCGSPGMIDACNVVLEKKGIKLENIYNDKF